MALHDRIAGLADALSDYERIQLKEHRLDSQGVPEGDPRRATFQKEKQSIEKKWASVERMDSASYELWRQADKVQQDRAIESTDSIGGAMVLNNLRDRNQANQVAKRVEGGVDTIVGRHMPKQEIHVKSHNAKIRAAYGVVETFMQADPAENPGRFMGELVELGGRFLMAAKEIRDNRKGLLNKQIALENMKTHRGIHEANSETKASVLEELTYLVQAHETSDGLHTRMEQVREDLQAIEAYQKGELDFEDLPEHIADEQRNGNSIEDQKQFLLNEGNRLSHSIRKIEDPRTIKLRIAEVQQETDRNHGAEEFKRIAEEFETSTPAEIANGDPRMEQRFENIAQTVNKVENDMGLEEGDPSLIDMMRELGREGQREKANLEGTPGKNINHGGFGARVAEEHNRRNLQREGVRPNRNRSNVSGVTL